MNMLCAVLHARACLSPTDIAVGLRGPRVAVISLSMPSSTASVTASHRADLTGIGWRLDRLSRNAAFGLSSPGLRQFLAGRP